MATYTPFDYSRYQYSYDDNEDETPAGAVTPQEPSDYTPPYGGKPAVPSPAAVLEGTIGANLGLMPDIKSLGRKVSNYFWNQMTKRVPGYEDMAAQSARNIGAMLRGEVPEDVLYQLGQGAAERGISRGGEFSPADYLRSLSLTSLGMMGEGEKQLSGALQRAESIPLYDISQMMLSPAQAYQAQLMANIYGAAPNPAAAADAARNAALQGMNVGGRGGPIFTGMPSLGGIQLGPGGQPKSFSTWESQWAPVGGAGTREGSSPPSFVYSPFAGVTGYESSVGANTGYGMPGASDWTVPMEDLFGPGYEDVFGGGYEDLGAYDWGGSEQPF